jgi:hypothetical protein
MEPHPRVLELERGRAGMCPHGVRRRSVDRGEEAAGSLVEREPSVLPGCALTESCQSLRISPDRARVRLMLFRQRVRLGSLFARQLKSLCDRIEHHHDPALHERACELRAESMRQARERRVNRVEHADEATAQIG